VYMSNMGHLASILRNDLRVTTHITIILYSHNVPINHRYLERCIRETWDTLHPSSEMT
jgi:hypothetical protein